MNLEANWQVNEKHIEDNVGNGQEYAGLTKTLYWSLMLDKQVPRIEERPIGHRSFLPQEVVWWEVWTWGFHIRHSYS